MELLAVVQLVTSAILLAVALGVRFSGGARIFNFVEYQRIANVPALHRWAGNKLLLVALTGMSLAVVSFARPQFATAFFCALMLILGAVVVWLLVGSAKFATLAATFVQADAVNGAA